MCHVLAVMRVVRSTPASALAKPSPPAVPTLKMVEVETLVSKFEDLNHVETDRGWSPSKPNVAETMLLSVDPSKTQAF